MLHAGRHPGHGAGRRRRRPRGPRRPDRAREHLPPDAPARRRRRRAPRRPARLLGLGRPPPHRLGRLPGVQPRPRRQRRRSTTTASRSAPPTTARRTGSPPRTPSASRSSSAPTSRCSSTCARRCRRPPPVVRQAVDRTLAWGERALAAARRPEPGAVRHRAGRRRRRRSASRRAERTAALGLRRLRHRRPVRRRVAGGDGPGHRGHARPRCPPDRPRYVMGLGDPVGMVEAVGLGVDLFDCVLPTRIARHGSVLTATGRVNLRNAQLVRGRRTRRSPTAAARCARGGRRRSCGTSSSSASPPPFASPPCTTWPGRSTSWRRMRCGDRDRNVRPAPGGGAFRLGVVDS